MKKENKMNLLDLMKTAQNYYGCHYVKIVNKANIEGTNIKESIYFDEIAHATSSENDAFMLLNYLNYESYSIEANITLVVLCDLKKVGE